MIIQKKLDNPKECNGCPCFIRQTICGYFHILIKNVNKQGKTIRPCKCLEKNSI